MEKNAARKCLTENGKSSTRFESEKSAITIDEDESSSSENFRVPLFCEMRLFFHGKFSSKMFCEISGIKIFGRFFFYLLI